MSLAILTSPEAVHAAIEEADRLGRDRFLEKYNFGPGSMFLKLSNGTEYDAEAILAAAVGKQYPDRGPLKPNEFKATPEEIKEKLLELGFTAVLATDAEDFSISSEDIGFFAAARAKARERVMYAELTDQEREATGADISKETETNW